ncbi:hypothetical protein IU470_18980 [Nocardia abscessus]|uniref:Uncharacterized protein n=1 Tax=Nocardia abscessus TaxID=120957 RepID=A0ABS0C9Z0_9NOCA|nr:hypothetical protein [Nocardia abscessus]MBF6227179.1 hypothetical protein [Nocardia abscessus]
MTRQLLHRRLRVGCLPQPQKSFHLGQKPLFVQLPERRVPRLVSSLDRSFPFLLGCRAGLGCRTLHAGRLSSRLFPSISGLTLRKLVEHREFSRHPFGGLTLNPCTLRFRRSACLSGTLGLLSGLPVTFGLLRGFRPAARDAFPEPQHLPELFATLSRLRQLRDLLLPLRLLLPPLLAGLLADTGQFELLALLQRTPSSPDLAGIGSRYDLVRELIREVSDQSDNEFLRFLRDRLTFDGPQHMLVIPILIQKLSHRSELLFVFLPPDSARLLFDGEDETAIFLDLVELDSIFPDFVSSGMDDVPCIAIAEESIGTIFEDPATLIAIESVAITVVTVARQDPAPKRTKQALIWIT